MRVCLLERRSHQRFVEKVCWDFYIIIIIAPYHKLHYFFPSRFILLSLWILNFLSHFQGAYGLEQRRSHQSDDGGDGGARNGRKTAHQSCTGSPEAWPKSLEEEEEDGVGERRRSARRWETSREVRDWWTSSPTRLIICHHTQLLAVTRLRNRSYACCHGFTPIITSIVSASFTPHFDKRRWFPCSYNLSFSRLRRSWNFLVFESSIDLEFNFYIIYTDNALDFGV